MLMISLQLIVANFLRQLETQMISNFQEQIQLQVGFLKNSVQPILERDDKDEVKNNRNFLKYCKITQQEVVL